MSESPTQEFPLAPEQTRILAAQKMTQRSVDLMNLHMVFVIGGPIDAAALTKTLEQVSRDNEAVRIKLLPRPDDPRQAIFPTLPTLGIVTTLKGHDADDDAVRKAVFDLVWKPFDLEHDCLIRAFLIPLSDRKCIFGMVINHFISDATSLGIVWKQIKDWYPHFAANAPAPTLPKRRPYTEFVTERLRWEREDADRDLPYWRAMVEGLQPIPERPQQPSPQAPINVSALSKPELVELQQFARSQRMVFFAILLTICFCFLFRVTKNDKVAIIVTRDGRNHITYFNTVGQFSLACPMSATRPVGITVGQFLQQVWRDWAGAMSRPWIPARFESMMSAAMSMSYLDADVLSWTGDGTAAVGVEKFQVPPSPDFKAPMKQMIYFANTRDGLEFSVTQPAPQFQTTETTTIVRVISGLSRTFLAARDMPIEDFIASV